jgi:hypothetical protein
LEEDCRNFQILREEWTNMSLETFVMKCGAWGLLPNNPVATRAYISMSVMAPLMGNAGFSSKLNKLCMYIPDLDAVNSLEQLKSGGASERLGVVLTCHEIIHNLHCLTDKASFTTRSRTKISDWDNEEELLTITGNVGTVALPTSVMLACNPRLFNEHSLCRILKLSNRPNHHSAPGDVTSTDTVDLSAMPMGIPSWCDS